MREINNRSQSVGIPYDTIEEVLGNLRKTEDPLDVRARLLETSQVYFDALISHRGHRRADTWKNQESTLNTILETSKDYIGEFYAGDPEKLIPETKKRILEKSRSILWYGKDKHVKGYHLNGNSGLDKTLAFYDIVSKTDFPSIDEVIPLASEGFEAGYLLASLLDSSVLPIRFSRLKRRDEEIKIPSFAPEDHIPNRVTGKNVLIAEGSCNRARSVNEVYKAIKSKNPNMIYITCVDLGGLSYLTEPNKEFELIKKQKGSYGHTRVIKEVTSSKAMTC